MSELSKGLLHTGAIALEDFLSVVAKARPSVGEEDIREHIKWT